MITNSSGLRRSTRPRCRWPLSVTHVTNSSSRFCVVTSGGTIDRPSDDAGQRGDVFLVQADVLAAIFLGLLGRLLLFLFAHAGQVRIDLAQFLGRIGDRLQAIGVDQSRGCRHISPLAAQRGAAAGHVLDGSLEEDVARVAIEDEQPRAVDNGGQIAVCAGREGSRNSTGRSFWSTAAGRSRHRAPPASRGSTGRRACRRRAPGPAGDCGPDRPAPARPRPASGRSAGPRPPR